MFEEYWKAYCIKHKIVVGSAYEKAIKMVAEDAYNSGYTLGYNVAH